MPAEALRVALLARPGVARERLRGVMDEAGVERVLEADPTQLELPALVAAAPRAVLVALDPATEDVLDRFDDVLFDPAIDVIYEEAELAAAREGWDVARWQRHLVAKLQRHGDVLPPGREPDEQPRPETALEPDALAQVAQSPAVEPGPAGSPPGLELEPVDTLSFDSLAASLATTIDIPAANPADHIDLPPPTEPAATTLDVEFAPMAGEANPFDPVVAEGDGDDGAAIGFAPAFLADFELADPSPDAAPEPAPALEEAAATAATTGFGNLSLEDGGDADAQAGTDDPRFRRDLDDLDQRISHLSLVDDTPVRGPEQPRGAVVVLAGIGGPDAVRQLLGALPGGFPRPVLIQQRLDGARHDRLVAQMQRATTIPVKLAEAGADAEAATIYILPAGVGIAAGDSGLRFDESGDVLSQLPSPDSAILLLSGSDAGQVDAVMSHSWAGALVAGQAADGCYDAAAANALATRGGDTASPVKIAGLLAERWA